MEQESTQSSAWVQFCKPTHAKFGTSPDPLPASLLKEILTQPDPLIYRKACDLTYTVTLVKRAILVTHFKTHQGCTLFIRRTCRMASHTVPFSSRLFVECKVTKLIICLPIQSPSCCQMHSLKILWFQNQDCGRVCCGFGFGLHTSYNSRKRLIADTIAFV